MKVAHICPYCRSVVPRGKTCPCRGDRHARQPYRKAYTDPAYIRNRALRYRMVGGLCENCHAPLKGALHLEGRAWQCHHVAAASRFTDPRQANAVDNLRCYCEQCHRGSRKPK